MRRLFLTPLVLAAVACAPPLRPLPPMAPLPEPPAESPVPVIATAAEELESPARWRDRAFEALRSRGLAVPVEGVPAGQIADTFLAARDGARVHNAVDIMARKGTPVLSADDGTILKVGTNTLGGNVIWAFDPSHRWVYYYAHLDHFRAGIREGQALARGDVIGYVGTTGNAPKDAPHLHFQLLRLIDGKHYSEGAPLNPLPLFVGTAVSH
ncbi:MAG: M23 family metallopeptidase [Gemmatimonadetes bacterium]|nr:M23 family metallopeptidase [Gemmatimonadota bacterium]